MSDDSAYGDISALPQDTNRAQPRSPFHRSVLYMIPHERTFFGDNLPIRLYREANRNFASTTAVQSAVTSQRHTIGKQNSQRHATWYIWMNFLVDQWI